MQCREPLTEKEGGMLQRLVLLMTLVLAAGVAYAQQGIGKPFGARDPRTCASREAGLSAAQAKQYFICDSEKVTQSTFHRISWWTAVVIC
jgi:hypothetical protein